VLLALAHLCWLQLRPDSGLRLSWASAIRPDAGRAAGLPFERLDRLAARTRDGNVLLKLAGDTEKTAAVEDSLSFVYYRISYALYPRRILVAPEGEVINNGWDILRIRFSPDPQWLQEHDVRSIVTDGSDDAGGETLRLRILAPRDDRARLPTGESEGD
jgi:hypothetical protein